jgi:DNA-directed RNA polymerase subunit RPC12/RpoP
MKKLIVLLAIVPVLIINACNSSSNMHQNEANMPAMQTQTMHGAITDTTFHAIDTTKLARGAMFYQCSMHTEVITDKPGNCPKCGMKLMQKQKSN